MCGTISSKIKRRLETTEMWLYRRISRIPWSVHVTNEEVLRTIGRKGILRMRKRRRQLKFLGYIMREEGLQNLAHTEHLKGKRYNGRIRVT